MDSVQTDLEVEYFYNVDERSDYIFNIHIRGVKVLHFKTDLGWGTFLVVPGREVGA